MPMKATLRCLLVAQLAQCGCGLRAGAALRPLHSQPHTLGGRPALAHGLRMAADSDEEGAVGTDAARQLLGMKGAADDEDNIWKIRLQLTKPVTWVPLIWGVACGAAASGNYHWWNPLTIGQPGHIPLGLAATDLAKAATCMVLSGPFLTGYTQTINDWYDREIDAINEPYRPIPSGKISEFEVIAQIWVLLLAGIGTAYLCDNWAGHEFPVVTLLSVFGALISYIYSAPPLKLKQSWVGNYALGASYISLPWWCGQARVPQGGRGDGSAHTADRDACCAQAMFGTLSLPVMVLTTLYSIAGLGIAIVNDFKSIEGDAKARNTPRRADHVRARGAVVARMSRATAAIVGVADGPRLAARRLRRRQGQVDLRGVDRPHAARRRRVPGVHRRDDLCGGACRARRPADGPTGRAAPGCLYAPSALGATRPINSIRRRVARDCTCSATRSSMTSSTKRARSRSSCSAFSRPPSRAPTPGSRLTWHVEMNAHRARGAWRRPGRRPDFGPSSRSRFDRRGSG